MQVRIKTRMCNLSKAVVPTKFFNSLYLNANFFPKPSMYFILVQSFLHCFDRKLMLLKLILHNYTKTFEKASVVSDAFFKSQKGLKGKYKELKHNLRFFVLLNLSGIFCSHEIWSHLKSYEIRMKWHIDKMSKWH